MKYLFALFALFGVFSSSIGWAGAIECSETLPPTSSGLQVTKGMRLEDSSQDNYVFFDFVREKNGAEEKYVFKRAHISGLACVFIAANPLVATCDDDGGDSLQVSDSLKKFINANRDSQGNLVAIDQGEKRKISFEIQPGQSLTGPRVKAERFEFDADFCQAQ